MKNNLDLSKSLSHRLGGFSEIEMSSSALSAACRSNFRYLEIDVRSSLDKELYLYHNPQSNRNVNKRFTFHKTYSSQIDNCRYVNGEKIMKLDEALSLFAENAYSYQKLCIDIKDYGLENKYLSLVRQYDLENRVCFISWIPKVLRELYEIGSISPMIFSHINFRRLSTVGKIISKAFRHRVIRLSFLLLMGECTHTANLHPIGIGYQHGYICYRLPPEILEILRSNSGGICVFKHLAGKVLGEYCRKNDLKLWIFSSNSRREYNHYASRSDIDVIFCNNTDL